MDEAVLAEFQVPSHVSLSDLIYYFRKNTRGGPITKQQMKEISDMLMQDQWETLDSIEINVRWFFY